MSITLLYVLYQSMTDFSNSSGAYQYTKLQVDAVLVFVIFEKNQNTIAKLKRRVYNRQGIVSSLYLVKEKSLISGRVKSAGNRR